MYEQPGWTIHSILQHELVILEIASCQRSSYFALPIELRNPMKESTNI